MDTSMDASFKGMCRTCLTIDTNYHSIYDNAGDEMKICDMLDAVLPQLLILKKDELPKLMCIECLDKLLIAYNFHQMCIESEGILLKILCDNPVLPTKEIDSEEGSVRTIEPNSMTENDNQLIPKGNIKVEMGEEEIQDCDVMRQLQDNHEQTKDVEIVGDDCSDNCAVSSCNDNIERIVEEKSDEEDLQTNNKLKRIAEDKTNEVLTSSIHNNETDMEEKKDLKICSPSKLFCQNVDSPSKTKSYSDEHSEKQFNTIEIKPNLSGQYTCTDCPRRFKYLEALCAHLQSHRKSDVVENVDFYSSKRSLPKRSNSGEENGFKCGFCDETFAQQRHFIEHTNKHNGLNPRTEVQCALTVVRAQFSCPQCEKSFNSATNLNQHEMSHADTELRYQCSNCSRKFKSLSDCNKHADAHHALDLHKCDVCGTTFKRYKSLCLHKRKHNNELIKFNARNRQSLKSIKQESHSIAEE